MKNNSFEEIFQAIKSHENIVIVTHTSPDGDAVAAAAALSIGLKNMGINSTILTEKIEDKYDIIPYQNLNVVNIEEGTFHDLKCDLFISVDCGAMDRFTEVVGLFNNSKTTINIDHHISNNYFANFNYVDVKASSTSQIMFKFLDEFNLLNKEICTAIYAGIVYDTGGFMHSCTTKETFKIASELLNFDIEHTEVYRRIMYSRTLEQNRAIAYVLGNMKLLDTGVCYLTITYEEFKNCGIPTDAFDSSVNHLINTKGVKLAFTAFEKKEGTTKISLRAHATDVNKIAAAFGGGGHILASGCAIKTDATEATRMILEEINKNGK